MVRLPAADTALNDKVADIFLDIFGDAAKLGIEIGGSGDEALRLRGNLGRGVGAVGLERGSPLPDSPPLVVFSFDCGVAPLDSHARSQGHPFRSGMHIAKSQGVHIFDLPAPVVGLHFDRLYGLVVVPCLGVSSTGGQIDFERLEDHWDANLDMPGHFLEIGWEQLFGLADLYRAYIDRGRVSDAGLLC